MHRHPPRRRNAVRAERSQAAGAPRSETESRLLEFFEISAAKCACCGEIAPLPPDYGVRDEATWDRKMDEHLAWARANKDAVLAALPHLTEWRESCEALRQVLESA